MKNILISFIRNNHLEMQKEENFENIDITKVVQDSSIDRLFLLTNKNREESINFKNWIADKLNIEVKAVTLEKGSEKYILNKVESIIKYILLAEEGHARFFYLPGENTLQINLWEIVNQNIYNGTIIYPSTAENMHQISDPPEKTNSIDAERAIPVYKDLNDKKIFTVKAAETLPKISALEKGLKSVKSGVNLLICGEEGTGKQNLSRKILTTIGRKYFQINFKTINPIKMEDEFQKIKTMIIEKEYEVFLLLNIEILPFYIQEQFTEFQNIQIISTFNTMDDSSLDLLIKKFYYLISSSIIALEPLRFRKEEFPQLVHEIIKNHNSNAVISDNALIYMQSHNWPGNFNEMNSVISRACIETKSVITSELIENSLDRLENDLNQWQMTPIGDNFKLNEILGDVAMHYIMLALEMSEGKKSKAARILGFSNYQTLSNWIKKYKK